MKRSRFELGLTVETLVSGHFWDAKRQFVTGAYENASRTRPLVVQGLKAAYGSLPSTSKL